MTEQEWNTSDNPAAMIQHAQFHGYGLGKPLASDRKLRLWVEACHSVAVPGGKFSHAMGLTVSAHDWSHHNGWEKEVPHAVRCNILRHIVGSPFRPVLSRPCGECGGEGVLVSKLKDANNPYYAGTMTGTCGKCSGRRYLALSPPTVECGNCDGKGKITSAKQVIDWAYDWNCEPCNGSGRLPAWPTPVRQLAEALYGGEDCAFALHDELMDAGYPELADHFNPVENGPGVCLWHPRGCNWIDIILQKT